MTKVRLVLPEVFRTEICAGLDPMLVAKVLADRGMLLRAERHYQRTHRIQGKVLRLYRLQIHMRGGIFRYVGAAQIERRANLPRGKRDLLHRPFVSSV
jgi:hypothetical protein